MAGEFDDGRGWFATAEDVAEHHRRDIDNSDTEPVSS
jgi:hypothetical protein